MKIPLILVLHEVRSMHNVGSLFRTSDALGLEKMYLCGLTGCPPHREIQKTALGATETVKWEWLEKTEDAIRILISDGFEVIALEQSEDAETLDSYNPNGKTALILGNELEGIPKCIQKLCSKTLVIEQYGSKKSLNVAVAGGIASWWLSKKLRRV